jgi:predicted flap endonuclease-1-like 5' DNA nuclease
VKDNLTNIIGILPIIETALNTAGIYHFDQIAHLTDENVSWLEGHLGIAGRIGREHWREQARDLAIISDRARKVAGKL